VVFIQLQIKQDYDRELDARASEGSVGKCLRERSDHDHRISPRNGEQNWHTVRSGSCMEWQKSTKKQRYCLSKGASNQVIAKAQEYPVAGSPTVAN
jgi:hypothetical protein